MTVDSGLAGRPFLFFVPLLFTLLGSLLYFNSLDAPFYFDDAQNIETNKGIRLEQITWSGLKQAAESRIPTRAIAYVTFALNYYFGGEQVAGYHAVNIAIHIINAILLFWLVRLTLQLPVAGINSRDAVLVAFFTALLWLVNPLQTQTVTYIVERWNSLAVMFYLAAFLMYIRGRLALSPVRRWLLFAGCTASGALGFFTKEITAVLPFFILLYEWFFFKDLKRPWSWRNLVLTGVVILVLVVIAANYTEHYSQYKSLLSFELPEYNNRWFTLKERLLTEPRVVLFYLGLLAFPAPSRLNLEHDFPLSYSLWNPPETFFAIAALLVLLVSAIGLAKRERLLAFCILWYLGHLVIESSVIGLEIIFEHRLYLPSIGVFLLVVSLAFRAGIPRWMVAAGLCVLAAVWSNWTIERNAVWGDPVLFWSDAAAKSPNLARPYFSLGAVYATAGNLDAAMTQFTRAIQVHDQYKKRPTAARPRHLTTYDLTQARSYTERGKILTLQGKLDEAKRDLDQAIRIAAGKVPSAYLFRGAIHHHQGDREAAMKDYSKAIQLKPEDDEAYDYRGDLRYQMEDYPGAVSDYRTLTRLKPDDPDAYSKLGIALMGLSNYKEAEQVFNAALEHAPPDWENRQIVKKKLFMLRLLESKGGSD
jgi:tetratricopeptide (TPR) repeat protein